MLCGLCNLFNLWESASPSMAAPQYSAVAQHPMRVASHSCGILRDSRDHAVSLFLPTFPHDVIQRYSPVSSPLDSTLRMPIAAIRIHHVFYTRETMSSSPCSTSEVSNPCDPLCCALSGSWTTSCRGAMARSTPTCLSIRPTTGSVASTGSPPATAS